MMSGLLLRAAYSILKYFSAILFVLFFVPFTASAQKIIGTVPDGTEGIVHNIYAPDSVTGKTKLPPNEFENSFSTFKVGLGFLTDYTTYIQSPKFKKQMDIAGNDLKFTVKVRDFRIIASGRVKMKAPVTLAWKFAFMYDGVAQQWLVRESGIILGIPKIHSHFFVGRTKEGFSLMKVMNGYSPWAMERLMAIDLVPIMADGIKWFGYLPKSRIFWNAGYFNDFVSKGQGFSTFSQQGVLRTGWLPVYDKEKNTVLHMGINLRYGRPLNDSIALKSRPESNNTPFLISTAKFPTQQSSNIGGEVYFAKGSLLIGSEVYWHRFYSATTETRDFVGGDVTISYFFTKTSRPYTTDGGNIFGFTDIKKSVYKKGWGELEGVLHLSYFELNDATIKGGSMWRITPMLNWHLSKNIRLEFVYGIGTLNRYDIKGVVQFFESRIQLMIL